MASTTRPEGRDVLVIGASAGGVAAVAELAAGLPRELPAAVFLVVHSAPGFPGLLPGLLSRRGPLRAAHPLHGEEIFPGRIYVALHGFQVFRCHAGHTFSLDSLAIEQAEEVERALWAAVRALEESAAVTRRVKALAPRALRARHEEKERSHAQQADVIRRILLSGGLGTRPAGPATGLDADGAGPAA